MCYTHKLTWIYLLFGFICWCCTDGCNKNIYISEMYGFHKAFFSLLHSCVCLFRHCLYLYSTITLVHLNTLYHFLHLIWIARYRLLSALMTILLSLADMLRCVLVVVRIIAKSQVQQHHPLFWHFPMWGLLDNIHFC